MSQTERHRIERLGHQGDGIAPGPVFVPRTLPGEVVEGRREGDLLVDARIVEPSGDRVAAPCPHYKACGGCALQHASEDFVAGWKLDVVRHALQAQGIESEFRDVITSPAQSRRRAVVAVRRTKKGAMAGFYGRASDVITEIPNCRLLTPGLISGLPMAEALAQVGASRKGALAVTMTETRNGLDVAVRGGKALDGPLQIELAGLAQEHGLARLAWEDETIATRMPPEQVFGGTPVSPPPGAFLQATQAGEDALLAAVEEVTMGAKRIADLFCGSGTFTLPLAHRAEVHGVEAVPEMLKALDRAWRHGQGLRRISTEARDLFRRPLMPDELRKFDAVVIDPPRAGAQAQMEIIADAQVPVVAAVSCNPVTFARDARLLTEAGYRLHWVQVVDQFRWSTHVELAAAFSLSH